MFLKPKHFIFECRPNFGSFYPLPGLLRAITFSAPKPPPLQISAYATGWGRTDNLFFTGYEILFKHKYLSGIICEEQFRQKILNTSRKAENRSLDHRYDLVWKSPNKILLYIKTPVYFASLLRQMVGVPL